MKRYESYKDSGVKWIGEMPSHWKVIPFKRVAKIMTNLVRPDDYASYPQVSPECIEKNSGRLIKHETVENSGVKSDNHLFYKGQLLYSKIRPLLNKVAIAPFDGLCSADMYPIETSMNIAFLKYSMLSDSFLENVRDVVRDRVKMPKINQDELSQILILVPPLSEQQNIANFLDEKCGETDGLLADLDAEVKTLGEYKKSLIAETVTRGLNPNAPMKQSGIAWAEEIPEHWKTQKGKYTFRLLQRPVKEDDGVITCFRDGEVTLRSNRREDGFTMSEKEYGYQGIEPGDLVVHGMDGFAGSIGISDSRGKATPVLNVLDSEHNKRYLMYYLRNMAYGDVFLALSTGIRVRSCDLSWKKLGEIRIVLPPTEEQNDIVAYLDEKCAAIDQSIADKQTQIETLKAYRASLIYEYVTGKKQVI